MSHTNLRAAIGALVLVNVVLLAGIAAMAVSPSARDAIASPLGLTTESQRNDVEARLDELESAVGNTFGIDDLSSRVDDLESRLDDLAAGSGDIAAESVDDVSARVDELEAELFNATSEFESRVDDVETRVDDLCSNLFLELDVFC
ncbi:MAG: hypothetical protein H0U82_08420 [Actinobacteria bacterium]|nr:hypothetical protein [Actinomycetota bacterium]